MIPTKSLRALQNIHFCIIKRGNEWHLFNSRSDDFIEIRTLSLSLKHNELFVFEPSLEYVNDTVFLDSVVGSVIQATEMVEF